MTACLSGTCAYRWAFQVTSAGVLYLKVRPSVGNFERGRRQTNRHAIRRNVSPAIDGIGGPAVLGLFSIRNDRRSVVPSVNVSWIADSLSAFQFRLRRCARLGALIPSINAAGLGYFPMAPSAHHNMPPFQLGPIAKVKLNITIYCRVRVRKSFELFGVKRVELRWSSIRRPGQRARNPDALMWR